MMSYLKSILLIFLGVAVGVTLGRTTAPKDSIGDFTKESIGAYTPTLSNQDTKNENKPAFRGSETLEKNDDIWVNGCTQNASRPFDTVLLSKSSGSYEGTLTYEIPELSRSGSYRIVFNIGTGENDAKWKMEFFPSGPGQSGSFSSTGTGVPCSLGTDSS